MIPPDIQEQLLRKAEKGNLTAIQILERKDKDKKLKKKKQALMDKAIFSSPSTAIDDMQTLPPLPVNAVTDAALLNDLDIGEIENYIKTGEFTTLPEHMTVYVKWMELAHDWYYKFKAKSWIIKSLMAVCKDKAGNAITVYMANKIFSDMLCFFYSDRDFKRNSWMLYLAERIMMGASMAWEMDDYDTYTRAIERAAGILDKVKLKDEEMDQRLLERRPRFFITDARQLGLPEIDRYALARSIDEMPVPERTKLRLKRDLGTEQRDMLDGESLGQELDETK